MAYLTDAMPLCPGYGYRRRAFYRVTVISAASAKTERNANWRYPLHAFYLPLENRTKTELNELLTYFHAAGARENTFPFLDRRDDRSCDIEDAPSQDDQTLGTAAASQTDFQLIKNYTAGGATRARKITRPIDSSVLIEKDGGLQTVTTHYTIQPGGIIRFVTPMTGGEVIKAGFRFYVPVAFSSDDIEETIHDYSSEWIGNASVELIEDRE